MTEREKIEQAVAEFYAYEDELIAQRRRATPGDDLISALINAEEQGDRLTHDELRNLVLNILVGGVDTSQSQLAHAVRLLAEHPDQWERPRADPRGLALPAVEEALRYEPITPFTARIVDRGARIPWRHLPAGSVVLVSAWHANREGVEPDGSTSPPSATAGARSPSAPASTTAWARTWPAPRCRRRWLSSASASPVSLDGEPTFGTPSGIYGLESLPVRIELAG